jgi:hopanoid biosynthesis associated protein HpnK
VRRLLINADDFGLTPGVNRAIVEAHTRGVVTSATLMANGRSFQDAVRRAQSTPRLSVGCHLVLVDGSPVLSAAQIPSLVDQKSKDGRSKDHVNRDSPNASIGGTRFGESLSKFAVLARLGRLAPEQIEAEATAQIRKLQAAGIKVSHVDSHKHTHLFPNVLLPLLRAAQACGVPVIRNPFGRVRFALVAKRPGLWKRYGEIRLLGAPASKFVRAVREAGMITPDGILGIVATGALDQQLFRLMVENLPDGTWEFVCHPGYNDAELQSVRTRLKASREKELEILTSAETRELLAGEGIELISYRDLARSA